MPDVPVYDLNSGGAFGYAATDDPEADSATHHFNVGGGFPIVLPDGGTINIVNSGLEWDDPTAAPRVSILEDGSGLTLTAADGTPTIQLAEVLPATGPNGPGTFPDASGLVTTDGGVLVGRITLDNTLGGDAGGGDIQAYDTDGNIVFNFNWGFDGGWEIFGNAADFSTVQKIDAVAGGIVDIFAFGPDGYGEVIVEGIGGTAGVIIQGTGIGFFGTNPIPQAAFIDASGETAAVQAINALLIAYGLEAAS